jgi:hypothetical protein
LKVSLPECLFAGCSLEGPFLSFCCEKVNAFRRWESTFLSFRYEKVKFGITGMSFPHCIDCPIRSSEPGDETRAQFGTRADALLRCQKPSTTGHSGKDHLPRGNTVKP